MKKTIAISLSLGCLAGISTSWAADLKQSKITQAVNEVQIISATDQTTKPATVNSIFTMPDILRTGPASRAELEASDETITRVGANTIFSFDPASRTVDLQQGSLLFHSPHGKGGGTIHTGSATASVLGSTLIVTTTPKGGFKVLALEDEAEIHFLNGRHQHLNPGEMTFILPGGNQLAPIIIFRLDNLTSHSLLVNGFTHPLPSLPLILHEIDKQTKLINSGRETDTGLLAGDNASPDQVEVLDPNTIQQSVSQSINAALKADATIDQPSLTDSTIPTPPNHVLSSPFKLPANSFFPDQLFRGFAARNISIDTPSVDLSPYADMSEFDIVAAENINIEASVKFDGFSSANNLALIAGNQISIAPNITLEADIGNFELSAPGAFTLDGVSLFNFTGNIGLTFGSTLSLEDSPITYALGNLSLTSKGNLSVSDSAFYAGSQDSPGQANLTSLKGTLSLDSSAFTVSGSVNLKASGDVTVNDSAIITDPDSGVITMKSTAGSVTISGTSIQAHYLTVNSGDGILLDGNGQSFTGNNGTINLTAAGKHGGILEVDHADFTSYAIANLIGVTVNLLDDAFNGPTSIKSKFGVWHNGYAFGDVNDLGGNTYNRTPIHFADGATGTLPGTQITVGPK